MPLGTSLDDLKLQTTTVLIIEPRRFGGTGACSNAARRAGRKRRVSETIRLDHLEAEGPLSPSVESPVHHCRLHQGGTSDLRLRDLEPIPRAQAWIRTSNFAGLSRRCYVELPRKPLLSVRRPWRQTSLRALRSVTPVVLAGHLFRWTSSLRGRGGANPAEFKNQTPRVFRAGARTGGKTWQMASFLPGR